MKPFSFCCHHNYLFSGNWRPFVERLINFSRRNKGYELQLFEREVNNSWLRKVYLLFYCA